MLCLLCAASGCTHVQLRKNTVNQAVAASEMEQQQVLDNLAMFVCDINSMPFFSYPNQSGSQVTDTGNLGGSAAWTRPTTAPFPLIFGPAGFSLTAQRSQQEAFTVTPINDPRKLELMRCAYQTAVGNCRCGAVSGDCPDCKTRFKVFYTGDPNGDIRQSANGITTSECLSPGCCWFHIGCKKCLPKDCSRLMVGEHCGVYVWVTPEGRDQLTKLTLTILDYALHDPPTKRTKQVEYYLDSYGLPTTQKLAVGKVTAIIAIDERPEGLVKQEREDEVRIEQFLDYRHKHVKERLALATNSDEIKALLEEDQMLESKLDFIHDQLRTGGLKEQYYPRSTAPTGTNLLQLDLYQNTMPNFGAP
jgi:hypothetical protein